MSTLTRCNFCTLAAIRERNPHAEITLVRNEHGWLDVVIDGVPGGHSFLEISRWCVC